LRDHREKSQQMHFIDLSYRCCSSLIGGHLGARLAIAAVSAVLVPAVTAVLVPAASAGLLKGSAITAVLMELFQWLQQFSQSTVHRCVKLRDT
jgi:hypothetical protein